MYNFSDPYLARILLLLAFVASLACSLALTLAVRTLALRFGWARGPESARHVHVKAIPRLGGVAIYFTVVFSLCVARLVVAHDGPAQPMVGTLMKLLLPASMLFLVGVLDDWKSVPAKIKLASQIGAGVWLYLLGHSVTNVSQWLPHALPAQLAGLLMTVVWVVWVSNAINLIDGLDGLAAGSSLFTALTLFIAATIQGNHAVALGTVIIGGAIVGFLRYNFNPASIFLGDGGSLFLGFMLSAISLIGSSQEKTPVVVSIALPMLTLGFPLLEVVLSVSRRFLSGKRIFDPDRFHIHHRLLDRGLKHRSVVLVLYAVSALFGMLALLLVHPTSVGVAVLIFTLCSLGLLGIGRLKYPEFVEVGRLARRVLEQRRVIRNSVGIWRTVEDLQRASTMEQIRTALETGLTSSCFRELHFSLLATPARAAEGLALLPAVNMSCILSNLAAPQHTVKLVLDLASPSFRGTLELVVDAERDVMVSMTSLFKQLHPALNAAIARMGETVPVPVRKPTVMLEFPLPPVVMPPRYASPQYNNPSMQR